MAREDARWSIAVHEAAHAVAALKLLVVGVWFWVEATLLFIG